MTITLTLPFIILAVIDIIAFIYAINCEDTDGLLGSARCWAIVIWLFFSFIAWLIYGGIYWW